MRDVKVRALSTPVSALGEGPLWDPGSHVLRWVDIHGRQLHAWRQITGWLGAVELPSTPSALLPLASGDFAIAMADGVVRATPDGEPRELLAHPVVGRRTPGRYNDAVADTRGRLWIGQLESRPAARDGALFRVDSNDRSEAVVPDLGIPNGIDFSPDGRTMYLTVTDQSLILAYDVDETSGSIANARIFAQDDDGLPDGLCVDARGYVWSAKWAGSRVARYRPDGVLDREIALTVRNVTSLAFGGPGLGSLFVTTGQDDDPEAPSDEPWLAGCVFEVLGLDTPGSPRHPLRLDV